MNMSDSEEIIAGSVLRKRNELERLSALRKRERERITKETNALIKSALKGSVGVHRGESNAVPGSEGTSSGLKVRGMHESSPKERKGKKGQRKPKENIDSKSENPELEYAYELFKREDVPDEEKLDAFVNAFVNRLGKKPDERKALKEMFIGLIENNAVPIDLLASLPQSHRIVSKTTFDQLFDAAMYLTFPKYRSSTVGFLLRKSDHYDVDPDYAFSEEEANTRLWKCVYPQKFGIKHVLIRASSYQEAFGRAADYALRMSVAMYSRVPKDLTIRVVEMSEQQVRRLLQIRWYNRTGIMVERGKNVKTARWIEPDYGVISAAIGHPKQNNYKVIRRMNIDEMSDIDRLTGTKVKSFVERESFRKYAPDELVMWENREDKSIG